MVFILKSRGLVLDPIPDMSMSTRVKYFVMVLYILKNRAPDPPKPWHQTRTGLVDYTYGKVWASSPQIVVLK